MTWSALFKNLKDPMSVLAIALIVVGQLQQQADLILSLVGPRWAGLILSGIGATVGVLNFLRGLAASPPGGEVRDDGTAGDSE